MAKDTNRIIFVTGIPRSGTNLLRAMLGAHPNLYAYNRDLTEEIVEHIRFGDMKRLKIKGITEKITKYLYKGAKCPVDNSLVLKNHYVLDYPEFINKALPDTYIFSIVRDPRAIFSSRMKWKHVPGKGKPHTIPMLIEDWNSDYDKYYKARGILKEHIWRIRYEDLCTHPKLILDFICNVIGEKYHPDMLDFENKWGMTFKGGVDVSKRSNSSFLDDLNDKPLIYKDSIDRWKSILSIEQILEIEEGISDKMLKYEYEYEVK